MGSSSSKPSHKGAGSLELKDKAAANAHVQQQTIDDLHRYINDPEDLDLIDLRGDPLIRPETGYRVELGGVVMPTMPSPFLEEVEKHSLYYKTNFCNKAHLTYVGGNGANPVVVSVAQLDKRKHGYAFCALVRTKKDDLHLTFTSKTQKTALKHLLHTVPELHGILRLDIVKDPKLTDELMHMEDRMLIKAYRFGVVYAGRSVDENTMFSNDNPSPGFVHFMNWIGKRVKLKGYSGFRGGLDVEHNTTGTHSYTTNVQGFDVMFHVSTELPLSKLNPQQVERKRHIGNDVVVFIYQDGPVQHPLAASNITSKFNHVYIVIQAVDGQSSTGEAGADASASSKPTTPRKKARTPRSKKGDAVEIEQEGLKASNCEHDGLPTKFRIAVVSKHGVRPHGPVLPEPEHIWRLDDTFRSFLLTKAVNAERAAYYAPGFGQSRTRRLWLKSLLEKYGPVPKAGASTAEG